MGGMQITGSGDLTALLQAWGIGDDFQAQLLQQAQMGGIQPTNIVPQAQDIFTKNETVNIQKEPKKVGPRGSVQRPSKKYNQSVTKFGEGYHQPVVEETSKKKHALSAQELAAKDRILQSGELRHKAGKVLGGKVLNDGGSVDGLQVAKNAANPGADFLPGMMDNQQAMNIMSFLGRMGALGKAPTGVDASAMQKIGSTSGGLSTAGIVAATAAGAILPGGAVIAPMIMAGSLMGGGGGGGGGGIGSLLGMAGMGGGGGGGFGTALMGMSGLSYQLRDAMKHMAADMKSDEMLAMINDPSIPIEDLIVRFMANCSERYEDQMRNKMEEMELAAKRENKKEMMKGIFSTVGSVAGMVLGGPMGAGLGASVGGMAANSMDQMQNLGGGQAKSQITLQMEVQVLMEKWKRSFEMLSNVSKSLHDMAMTAIRNIRG